MSVINTFRVEKRNLVKDWIMMDGNSAAALGAVYAGCTCVAWYPITPSTSVVEAFMGYAEELRVDEKTGKNNFAIVQAEDELAAIGMVIGAGWNGARSFGPPGRLLFRTSQPAEQKKFLNVQ